MRSDGDFHGYVAARWPALVRTVVLLGCPVELAPDVVAAGLGSCRRDWRVATEQGDVDVARAPGRRRGLGRAAPGHLVGRAAPGRVLAGPDLSDLDRLTPDVRAGLVLRRFADLDAAQAEAVAGPQAGGPLPDTPDAAAAAGPGRERARLRAPTDDELGRRRPPWWRRRRVLTGGRRSSPSRSVLGGWAVVANRPVEPTQDDGGRPRPGRAEAARATRPRSRGTPRTSCTSRNATYVLPTLRDLAVLGAGAVYGDVDGRVVHLADDGTRTLLGTKDPAVPLAASDQLGWVAWVDPAGANPRLLVYDVGQAEIIGELDLPASRSGPQEEPDTRPVAIDQQTVYFVTAEGARAWRPTRRPGLRRGASSPRRCSTSRRRTGSSSSTPSGSRIDQPFVADRSTTCRDAVASSPTDGDLRADPQTPPTGRCSSTTSTPASSLDVQPPDGSRSSTRSSRPRARSPTSRSTRTASRARRVSDSNPIRGELVTCRLRRRRVRGPGDAGPGLRGADPGPLARSLTHRPGSPQGVRLAWRAVVLDQRAEPVLRRTRRPVAALCADPPPCCARRVR